MSAVATKTERIALPLAEVGRAFEVAQTKRRIDGLPRWSRWAFNHLWRPLVRFASAKLKWPVMLDKDGCWVERQGVFTSKELAEQAIASRPDWFWTEVPVNGLNPEPTGRYGAQDTPGASTLQYKRANGHEVINKRELEALFREGEKTYQAAARAVSK